MTQKAVDWNLQEKKPTLDDLNRKRFIKRILDWSQTHWKSWGSRGVDMQPRIMPKISPLTWWTGTPWLPFHGTGFCCLHYWHCWSLALDTGTGSSVQATTEIQPSNATSTADERELLKVPPTLGWAHLTLWCLGHMSLSWLQGGLGKYLIFTLSIMGGGYSPSETHKEKATPIFGNTFQMLDNQEEWQAKRYFFLAERIKNLKLAKSQLE